MTIDQFRDAMESGNYEYVTKEELEELAWDELSSEELSEIAGHAVSAYRELKDAEE